MNNQLQKTCAELRAELEALHKKIQILEAKQAESGAGAIAIAGRRFPKNIMIALIPLLGLLAAGGLLYGQGAGDALFINPRGWVGIGTNAPKATLDVAGKLNVSDNTTLSNTTLSNATVTGYLTTAGNVGIGTASPGAKLEVAGDTRFNGAVGINRGAIQNQHLVITPASGNIPFNITDPAGSTNWLSVLAKGNVIMNGGNVGIGTTNPEAKLDVGGDARIRGKVSSYARYQRNDQTESTYDISPQYHLSLTAPAYGGRTKTIAQDILVALCGDADGCEVRLGMTRWSNDNVTETASVTFEFYYFPADGHWRSSAPNDTWGVDGDNATNHVRDAWNTCYFTDGTYSNYQNQGDQQKGMQLLVYNGYAHPNCTCELTLID